MSKFILLIKGVAIGIANIIPGLSGGTVAVILGLYHTLIQSLANLISFQKHLFFNSFVSLFFVFLGAGLGVFGFSFVIDWLLLHYQESISFFFIGVILSSIPYVIYTEKIQIKSSTRILICIIFTLIGLTLVYSKFIFDFNGVSTITPLYLFFSVVIAAAAMIIPGVSGSLVLVLLGVYSTVIYAIKNIVWIDLGIVILAVFVGVLGISKILNKCIKRYFHLSMSAIIGLMIGTLPSVYYGFSWHLLYLNMICFFAGIVLVWSFRLFK